MKNIFKFLIIIGFFNSTSYAVLEIKRSEASEGEIKYVANTFVDEKGDVYFQGGVPRSSYVYVTESIKEIFIMEGGESDFYALIPTQEGFNQGKGGIFSITWDDEEDIALHKFEKIKKFWELNNYYYLMGEDQSFYFTKKGETYFLSQEHIEKHLGISCFVVLDVDFDKHSNSFKLLYNDRSLPGNQKGILTLTTQYLEAFINAQLKIQN